MARPTNDCRDFSRQNEVAGRLQVRSIEDLVDQVFKIFVLIFVRFCSLYLSQGVTDTLHPFCDLRLGGVARQEVIKLCHLGQSFIKKRVSIQSLLFLGRCRTEDLSLEEVLQQQRLRQQMWQKSPKPESITGRGKLMIYLHPLTAENEMRVCSLFQGTASLSVGPCFTVTHVLRSVRRPNFTRDNSIILHNAWLSNEIPYNQKYMSTER